MGLWRWDGGHGEPCLTAPKLKSHGWLRACCDLTPGSDRVSSRSCHLLGLLVQDEACSIGFAQMQMEV